MSIVVVPGQFHSVPHPAGKLASTLLSVAVAGMADPARFRRGKTYVAEHAVSRLEIKPGELVASVTGSRDHPYQVFVTVEQIPRFDTSPEALRTQLTRLTPDAGEMMVSCTCPDFDDPCKHAVAALLAFANELVARPELLVQWRCIAADEAPRAKVGARARASERHLKLAPPLPPERAVPDAAPWESTEWQTFLGDMPPELPQVADEPVKVGRAMLGTIDLAAVVRSAIDAITTDH
jgi:SWIM zinc finger